MYIAHICLLLWLCGFTEGTIFDREAMGITDITAYPIPAGTTRVWFDGNLITLVPAGLFVNLPYLWQIFLHENLLSDIEDFAFTGVPNVTSISVRDNYLEVIREHMFSGLPNLQVLSVSNNLLHTVEPGSFRDLTALIDLYLRDNSLHTLSECMFEPENHTQNLDIRFYNNPLSCDQYMCWLKQAEGDWITVTRDYDTACAGPGALNGTTWDVLTELDLNCNTQPAPNCGIQGEYHKQVSSNKFTF